jgi:hypothetical protein
VWSKFRLLGAADAPHTHECTICGEKIQVYNKRQTNIPLVTEARRHLETKHPADLKRLETSAPNAAPLPALFALQKSQQESTTMANKIEQARRAISQFYINCPQRLSKATVTGEHFRQMLRAAAEVPPKFHDRVDMCRKTLAKHVEDAYDEWTSALKKLVAKCLEVSRGNPFAQGIHDTVTLKNGQKNLALGFSFVDPWSASNFTACIGFVPVDFGTASGIAAAIDELCVQVTGFSYTKICASTMSDYAALNVARVFDHEEEGCSMHNNDKEARYAVGDLHRTRQGRPVEPFPDGEALMAKAQKCATYFSYGRRRLQLRSQASFIEGGMPDIVPKTDISTTRVAARHSMIESVLLLNLGLRRYASGLGFHGR